MRRSWCLCNGRHLPTACIVYALSCMVVLSSCSSLRPSRSGAYTQSDNGTNTGYDTEAHGPLRKTILEYALQLLHKEYCFGGVGPDCFDCSGFVGFVFNRAGVLLPRTSTELSFYAGLRTVDRTLARPGDVVFFDLSGRGKPDHVGILLTSTKFIHASTSRGVVVDDIEKPPFSSNLLFFRSP